MSLYPKLEDLSTWTPSNQAVCEQLPNEVWKLSTPGDKGIFHAIMTSYLISSTKQEIPEHFKYRLTGLFGKNALPENIQNNLKKSILFYNPFRNSNQLNFSKRMVRKFKENLNSYFEKRNKNCENANISEILTAASSMLNCSFFLYKTNKNRSKSLEIYQTGTVSPFSPSKLYIFHFTYSGMEPTLKNSFNYGLTKADAYPFRKAALKQSLKLIKFDKYLNIFPEEIFLEDTFLISILRCHNSHVINKIFNFPLIISDLVRSGFKINPLTTDENGLSSFSYAFRKADFTLVLWLYDYAIENVSHSDNSDIKTEMAILNIVERIRYLLENDKRILSFSGIKTKDVIHAYLQFLYFIEYHIDFMEKTIEIKENDSYFKKNNYTKCGEKQVIIALIDTYKNYFYFNILGYTTQGKFENYLEYNNYYTIVDNFFSYIFFEHFLSLRYYLKDNIEGIFADTVASLFLLIQSKMFFNKNEISNLYPEGPYLCYIAYNYREKFLSKVGKLKAELEKIGNEETAEPRDVTCVVKSFMIDHPEISNVMIAGRIKHYLAIVSNTKNSKTFKKMLVIERALQVFGELIQNEGVTNCPMKHYLCSCFEDGAEPKIMFIRNCLSHYKSNFIQGQLYIENNVDIIEKLNTELKDLNEIFNRVDHLCEIQDIMIQRTINEAKLDFKDAVPYLEAYRTQFSLAQKETYLKDEVSFALLTKNMLNYMLRSMEKMKSSPLIEDRKIEVIRNIVEALIHLLDFKISFSEDIEVNNLKLDLESFRNIHSQMKDSYTLLQCEKTISPLIEKCLVTVSRLQVFKNNRDTLMFCSSLITKELHEKYQKFDIFTSKERYIIRKEMKTCLEKSKEAKSFCLLYIDTEDANVLKKKLSIIATTKAKKRSIENFIDNDSRKRAKEFLEKIEDLTVDSIFKPEDHTTDTILSMSTEVQRVLLLQLKLFRHPRLRKKVLQLINQKISFLINRINKMKEILINEDKRIQFLWRHRKNKNIKVHVKNLICQRYLQKHETRAAVEMLLMDCMGVFGDKKKEKELWVKSNDLFTGINLRDILVHGNPLVQRVSNILDPSDFVSALIDHVIELMDDRNMLNALSILWFMQRETNLSNFIKIVEGEDNKIPEICSKTDLKVRELRIQITNSKRWEKYVKLLPLSNKS